MKAILDTSSLSRLAVYYLPLDKSGRLKEFVREKYYNGEILLIDKVADECMGIHGGLILEKLEFLKDKSLHIKTNDLLPNREFFNFLKQEFLNHSIIKRQGLTAIEVEAFKNDFLNNADCKIILYAQSIISQGPVIVTEETPYTNDGKIVKKIPSNCKLLNLPYCDLPTLLSNHYNLQFEMGNSEEEKRLIETPILEMNPSKIIMPGGQDSFISS